ncbi:hypothetical protein [Streptomyces palmae]|uniref:hypothetical protein n=1 Tax=Streptomyces palmae TaxID=1701085 RepID=UPI001AE0D7F5|nr:hypothetical protein [Streptomyces palmae]
MLRTLALKTFSFAFASATSSRSVFSPTTGNRARRTTSSGLSTAAVASLKRMPSLPRTFFFQHIWKPAFQLEELQQQAEAEPGRPALVRHQVPVAVYQRPVRQ